MPEITQHKSIHNREEILKLYSQHIKKQLNDATTFEKKGDWKRAVEIVKHLVESNPHEPHLWEQLVQLLLRHKLIHGAIEVLFQALTVHPNYPSLSVTLAKLLRYYKLSEIKKEWINVFVQLCNNVNIGNVDISYAITDAVQQIPSFVSLLHYFENGNNEFPEKAEQIQNFFHNELVIFSLPQILFRNENCEHVFTFLRRIILKKVVEEHFIFSENYFPRSFVCSLARQCFFNEYVFSITEEEQQHIEVLFQTIENKLQRMVPLILNENELLLLSLYKPLSSLSNFFLLKNVMDTVWSESFQPIIREQVENILCEQELAKSIPSLTEIESETSRAVQQQYEENPYPRWLRITRSISIPFEQKLKQFFPQKNFSFLPKPIPVLVAGCGTGFEPISISFQFSNCKILAIDLSRKSLTYAKRKAMESGITNIEFQQADILFLRSLKNKFYLVECSGVLHHLQNLLEGWKILVDLLHKDGIMKVSLYSESARKDVREAKIFLEEKNFHPTENGIRKARQAILQLPTEHPAREILLSRDFYTTSSCRDLLMHVQEQQFTITKIGIALKELGLRFLRFELDPRLRNGFTSMFPEHEALSDLYKWKLFENKNPTAFTGMYKFWCCKK